MRTINRNSATKVKRNKVVIVNGLRYEQTKTCRILIGTVRTFDGFHNYSRKQIA